MGGQSKADRTIARILNYVVPIFASFAIAFSFFSVMSHLFSPPEQKVNRKFVDNMIVGMKSDAINNLDDVLNIFLVNKTGKDNYRSELTNQLRFLLVVILNMYQDGKLDRTKVKVWKDKIAGYIIENEKKAPFSALPPVERTIFSDISFLIENGKTKTAQNKLLELAKIIEIKLDNLSSEEAKAAWTLPLSIVGVFFTVLFGWLAIRRPKKIVFTDGESS